MENVRGKKLSLQKPLIMGILNVTPDSFSDGGKFKSTEEAVEHALKMVQEGADIIDIGGESTGPGSKDVVEKEELERVLPVIEGLRKKSDVWISVDTYKAEVARHALEKGVDMVNDVTALRGDEKMVSVLAEYDVPIVIMYAKDPTARTTREAKNYDDVVKTVHHFLVERLDFGVRNGIRKDRFILDPGMGAFVSSDSKYSLQLLKRLDEFKDMGLPILVGASRKGFIGEILKTKVQERLEGSLACAAVALMNGASILRVHDVQETRRVADMVHAIMTS